MHVRQAPMLLIASVIALATYVPVLHRGGVATGGGGGWGGGGCIPYAHVCNNVYECADSSDEFCIGGKAGGDRVRQTSIDLRFLVIKSSIWCFGFICSSGICIDGNFVNDLIPDCSDAGDEFHSLAMKYHGLNF